MWRLNKLSVSVVRMEPLSRGWTEKGSFIFDQRTDAGQNISLGIQEDRQVSSWQQTLQSKGQALNGKSLEKRGQACYEVLCCPYEKAELLLVGSTRPWQQTSRRCWTVKAGPWSTSRAEEGDLEVGLSVLVTPKEFSVMCLPAPSPHSKRVGCGVWMFAPCMRGFSQGTLASSKKKHAC